MVSVGRNITVRRALDLMREHGISQVPVLDGSESVGSVTENGLMEVVLRDMKRLDADVDEHLDAPFPVVQVRHSFEHVKKLLSHGNRAVLVRDADDLSRRRQHRSAHLGRTKEEACEINCMGCYSRP